MTKLCLTSIKYDTYSIRKDTYQELPIRESKLSAFEKMSSNFKLQKTRFLCLGSKRGSVFKGALATKKLLPRLSFAELFSCSNRERKKNDQSGHPLSNHAGDTAFAPATLHFSSARELSGTKFDLTRVEKVYKCVPICLCCLRICAHRRCVAKGMYRKGEYEKVK